MKTLLAALLLLLPAAAAAQPSVLLRAEVSPTEMFIGDPLEMKITVLYSTGLAPVPVEFAETIGDFELLTSASSEPRADRGDRMSVVHTLTLTTFSTGTARLAPVPIYFRHADGALSEARTDEITVTVKSLLAEKGDEGGLRPLKGLYNARSLWLLWALLGVLAAGLIAWLIVHLRRRRSAAGETGPAVPALSPEDEAMQALDALQNGTLIAEGQFKEFYSALSDILRRYAERRYGLTAMEMTSSELLAALRKAGVATEPLNVARAALDNADLVKFAKWTPEPEEVTADVDRLRAFVTATTPVLQAPAEPAPQEEAIPL